MTRRLVDNKRKFLFYKRCLKCGKPFNTNRSVKTFCNDKCRYDTWAEKDEARKATVADALDRTRKELEIYKAKYGDLPKSEDKS